MNEFKRIRGWDWRGFTEKGGGMGVRVVGSESGAHSRLLSSVLFCGEVWRLQKWQGSRTIDPFDRTITIPVK